jgi:hypothetical protein
MQTKKRSLIIFDAIPLHTQRLITNQLTTCRENGVKLHYVMDMAQLKKYIEASKFVTEEIKKMIL